MKIVFLSFSDHIGGASMAAHSIFKSLKLKKSVFLTVRSKFKHSIEIYNIFKKIYIYNLRIIEKFLIFLFNKKKYHQSLNIFNTFTKKKISNFFPDIINIHWVNRSMISLKELNSFKEKILISLHDMWFINSTEHYFEGRVHPDSLIEKYCWEQKKQFLYKKNVYFVAHNKWMFNKFLKMHPSLKKKIFISKYYPIDTKVFKPKNKAYLRKKYNIPLKKKIILFSAQDIGDERKGFSYFKKIIKNLSKDKKFYFISVGKSNPNLENLKNYQHINFLGNKKTSDIYSLSDIYICTSLIDNLPLTILEALSSGNLVISFKNGGSEEVLKKIGYTFKLGEVNKMIKFIENLDNKIIKKKSKLARKFAIKNLSFKNTRKQYLNIFQKIYNEKI